MNNFNVEFPYPVGSYLTKEENRKTHIDQVEEYTIDKNGIHTYLILDVFSNPRSSKKIDIDDLVNNWKIYEQQNNKGYSKVKKIGVVNFL